MLPAMVNFCRLLSWTTDLWWIHFDDICCLGISTTLSLEQEEGKVVAHLVVEEEEEAVAEQRKGPRARLFYSCLVLVLLNSTKSLETQQRLGYQKD